jgi:hypothetical protein
MTGAFDDPYRSKPFRLLSSSWAIITSATAEDDHYCVSYLFNHFLWLLECEVKWKRGIYPEDQQSYRPHKGLAIQSIRKNRVGHKVFQDRFGLMQNHTHQGI